MTSEALKNRPTRTTTTTTSTASNKASMPINIQQRSHLLPSTSDQQQSQKAIKMDNNQAEFQSQNHSMLSSSQNGQQRNNSQQFIKQKFSNNNNNSIDLDHEQQQKQRRQQNDKMDDKMKLTEEETDLADRNQLDASSVEVALDDPTKQQHHVGPVMGIFFKVWSLVKVTRGRHHQQKMRRQNSEDAGQFHFISGEQLASTSGQSQLASAHILQDNHFRRAGSQPAPSSHHSFAPAAAAEHLFARSQQHQHRLQVGGGAPLPPPPQQHPAGTTSGSSSGVSSITSSTLGSGVGAPSDSNGTTQSRGAKLNNNSAMSSPPPTKTEKPNWDMKRSSNQQQAATTKGTWASRIKRSATTLNQHNQHSQRSEKKPANRAQLSFKPQTNQAVVSQQSRPGLRVGNLVGGGAVPSLARQARATSEQTARQPDDELHKRWMRAHLISRETTISDDYDDQVSGSDDDDDDNENNVNNEDSDLNDIYSTPNDSIQSVPAAQQQQQHNQPPSSQQTKSNAFPYPMKKSFSANNFSLLVNSGSSNNTNQCGPIDEQQETTNNNHVRLSSKSAKLHQQPNNGGQADDDSKENRLAMPTGNSTAPLQADGSKRLLAGSRFFISSSSSEESNPPAAFAAQTNKPSTQTPPTDVKPLPINYGLHYHGPPPPPSSLVAAARPDSLILTNGGNNQMRPTVQLFGPPLFTPTSNGGETLVGTPLVVAAMSPAAAVPLPLPSGAHYWVPPPPACGYKKSPSLFEMSHNNYNNNNNAGRTTRFSSKFPLHLNNPHMIDSNSSGHRLKLIDQKLSQQQAYFLSSFKPITRQQQHLANSISLQDCKLTTAAANNHLLASKQQQPRDEMNDNSATMSEQSPPMAEYKLTQMLLESGSNPMAKDQSGCTALMHSVLSENLPALKCLVERARAAGGAELNATNNQGLSALDLVCGRTPSEIRLEMLKLLIDNQADLDRTRESDGTRLLDRLIAEHADDESSTRLAYIDCLLHNGAKLGSSTWFAAAGKPEIQLRLLRKLCQDGYFLYKKSSIEPAVYRFEYALKRIAELERQQLHGGCRNQQHHSCHEHDDDLETMKAIQLIKYQTYLGLSRCERKRRFFKRALEFAHMSILVNSTSYEGYYSKAHILKDLGEIDEALSAINQTNRLVDNTIELIKNDLSELQHREESIVFDGCFQMHDPNQSCLIEASRQELLGNLEYLQEAKKHISRLKGEILEDGEARKQQ